MVKIKYGIASWFIFFAAVFLMACNEVTESQEKITEEEFDVWYEVKVSDNLSAYAEYTPRTGTTISHNVPGKWTSDIFTVETGTEMFISATSELPSQASIQVRIYVDGVLMNQNYLQYIGNSHDPVQVTIPVKHIVGDKPGIVIR